MVISKYSSNKILYIDENTRIEYKKGNLVFFHSGKIKMVLNLYQTHVRKVLACMEITDRALRLEPRYVDKYIEDTYLVSCDGSLLVIDENERDIRYLYRYSKGTKNPLHFCKYKRDGREEVVFGDYGGHDSNGNVGIYRLMDFQVTQIASIPGDVIDHIHRIEYDYDEDCYWIFTGDTNVGSAIWKLEYYADVPQVIVSGKQQYRCCVAFIEKNYIIYATDTPLENNYLYKLDKRDLSISKLGSLKGSIIYGMRVNSLSNTNQYCIATTVEPDSRLFKWRYLLTSRLGPGIKDRFSHVYIIDEGELTEIWKSKKDLLPMVLFQFGNQRFPRQYVANSVFLCPQSCVDKGTWVIRF